MLIALGIGIPILSFLVNGFFTLEQDQAAVIVEYNLSELLSSNTDPWTHLIALKEGQLPGGEETLVGRRSRNDPLFSIFGKDLYWHLPAPFGKHLKIDIYQQFQVEIPLVIPNYMYERDDEGNIIELMRDDLEDPVVIGYYFVTMEGIKFYTPDTWTRLRYSPDFELDVLKVVVTGEFKVTDVNTYAASLVDAHGNKIDWMETLGFYGEITNPPLVNDQLENYFLDEALRDYILDFKLFAVMSIIAEQNPDSSQSVIIREALDYFMADPKNLIDRISTNNGTIPNFEDFITSDMFIEQTGVDIEDLFGIDIAAKMDVQLFEEPL